MTGDPLERAPTPPDEPLYRQARQELSAPKPIRTTGLLFIALFLFFVLGQFGDMKSPSGIIVLLLVIAFHEAGHAAGMRLFGFKDVRMFFIPFFGAAVSGRARGVAAWKEAVVSLLGPLPGIIAGIVIYVVMQRRPFPLAVTLVQSLLFLNVFNLLPFGFLDGGRFLERVLFSRHRVLEVGFQGVGCVLLALLAAKASLFVLGFFALFTITRLPQRWRTLGVASRLRTQYPTVLPDPEGLGDVEGRAVFAAARGLLAPPHNEQPAVVARTMEALLDGMKRAPGALASIGLLLVYGISLLVAAFGVVFVANQTGPASWQTFEQPAWRAEFPRPPTHFPARTGSPDEAWRSVIEGTERFTVTASPGADDGAWMDAAAQRLASDTHLALTSARPIDLGGHAAREVELSSSGRVLRARLVAADGRRYVVSTSAPRWGDNQRRFLESFTLVDTKTKP
jgi:Zn-dependent protease